MRAHRHWVTGPRMLKFRAHLLTPTALLFLEIGLGSSCARRDVSAKSNDSPSSEAQEVGTAIVKLRPVAQRLTLSSELVPFQEIDVYAKEAGYVKELNVDYGSHVRKGQIMAVLEVPELQAQLDEDQAAIRAQQDQVARAESEVGRAKAQHNMVHLQYQRLAGVAKAQAGLVAQQEVDDAQGRIWRPNLRWRRRKGAYQAAQSQLIVSQSQAQPRSGALRLFENHGSVRWRCHAEVCQSRRAYAGRNHFDPSHSAGPAL